MLPMFLQSVAMMKRKMRMSIINRLSKERCVVQTESVMIFDYLFWFSAILSIALSLPLFLHGIDREGDGKDGALLRHLRVFINQFGEHGTEQSFR